MQIPENTKIKLCMICCQEFLKRCTPMNACIQDLKTDLKTRNCWLVDPIVNQETFHQSQRSLENHLMGSFFRF